MSVAASAFDDIAGLQAQISDRFGPWGPAVEITQAMIGAFADVTDDHQWIHVDVERAAAESPFGGSVAHGFLTLALVPSLVRGAATVTGYRSATNYGIEGLRFVSPVRAGSRVHARSRFTGVHERPSGGTLVTREIDVRAVDASKPAIILRLQILYR